MNRLEKFGLWTGIVGLVSNTIALITFFAGFWGAQSSTAVVAPATVGTSQPVLVTITTY